MEGRESCCDWPEEESEERKEEGEDELYDIVDYESGGVEEDEEEGEFFAYGSLEEEEEEKPNFIIKESELLEFPFPWMLAMPIKPLEKKDATSLFLTTKYGDEPHHFKFLKEEEEKFDWKKAYDALPPLPPPEEKTPLDKHTVSVDRPFKDTPRVVSLDESVKYNDPFHWKKVHIVNGLAPVKPNEGVCRIPRREGRRNINAEIFAHMAQTSTPEGQAEFYKSFHERVQELERCVRLEELKEQMNKYHQQRDVSPPIDTKIKFTGYSHKKGRR